MEEDPEPGAAAGARVEGEEADGGLGTGLLVGLAEPPDEVFTVTWISTLTAVERREAEQEAALDMRGH